MKKNFLPFFKFLALLVGLIFLVTWVVHLGPGTIWSQVTRMKVAFFWVMANSLGWYILYTQAWRNLLARLTVRLSFFEVLRVKVCGEAINLISPFGFVAGDPYRVLMLGSHLSVSQRTVAVFVDRALHILASFLFVCCGLLLVFVHPQLISKKLALVCFIFYTFLFLALVLFIFRLVTGRVPLFVRRFMESSRLMRRYPGVKKNFETLAADFTLFAKEDKKPILVAFFFHFLGRVLGAVEIGIIFVGLTGKPYWFFSMWLASLTAVFNTVFTIVPGGVGVIETLYAGFFSYFSLSPSLGLSMQLIRRIRSLIWVALGLVLLQGRKRRLKPL